MGHAAKKSSMASAEYLVWEAAQSERHEFVNGEVFAMSSAEERHVTVTGNLYVALRQHLRGTPCRTLIVDMKLHVAATNSYFYPDVMVTCSAADDASPLTKSEPTLLAEVLSPNTAAYRGGPDGATREHEARHHCRHFVCRGRTRARSYAFGVRGLISLPPALLSFIVIKIAIAIPTTTHDNAATGRAAARQLTRQRNPTPAYTSSQPRLRPRPSSRRSLPRGQASSEDHGASAGTRWHAHAASSRLEIKMMCCKPTSCR